MKLRFRSVSFPTRIILMHRTFLYFTLGFITVNPDDETNRWVPDDFQNILSITA